MMINADVMNMRSLMAECEIAKKREKEELELQREREQIDTETIEWIEHELMKRLLDAAEHGLYNYHLKLARTSSFGSRREMRINPELRYSNGDISYKPFGDGKKFNPDILIQTLTNAGYKLTVLECKYKSWGFGIMSGIEIIINWKQ